MKPHSNPGRLPIKRIAITVPPAGWFHGIARALFDLYRQALVDLGLAVFDVPVDAFVPPDAVRISRLIADLKTFRPDFVLGLSHGSYALMCRMPAGRDGWRPNLFTEVLDVPTVCLWDHAPVELAGQLLTPGVENPAASSSGARETLRRILTHPRLVHWSRDSGQTEIMQDLGFALPNQMVQELAPTLPGFHPQDTPAGYPDAAHPDVAFVGHFYQDPAHHPHAALAELAHAAIREWLHAGSQPLWGVLTRQIAQMDPGLRDELALDCDQTYFWHFAQSVILHQAQTASRLNLLGSAQVPVACYGNLRMDAPGVPANLLPVPGPIAFGPPLAAILARHPITIDALNPGFVHGYSHKPVLCFAAGGFMLLDRKRDFVGAFGEAGEAVSYADAGDLAAKVDRFLGNPKYRREVAAAIRERIDGAFQLKDVLSRVLNAAYQLVGNAGPVPSAARPARDVPEMPGEPPRIVADLLPAIHTEPHWQGAMVQPGNPGAWITTSPEAWAFAAVMEIPQLARLLKEPYLRVTLRVETGRIGLCTLRGDTGESISEQLVSPSAGPVTVTIELPCREATQLILRNTVGTVSRALLLEAGLCARTV